MAANPARYAARAAATAASSWVRRDPISMIGRPAAAETMRAAADGDRAVVVEDRQRERLQHDGVGERAA